MHEYSYLFAHALIFLVNSHQGHTVIFYVCPLPHHSCVLTPTHTKSVSGSNQALPLGFHGLPVNVRWLYGQPGSVIVGGVFGCPAGPLEEAKLGIGKSINIIKSLASEQLIGMELKELNAMDCSHKYPSVPMDISQAAS